jgi:hypothetical protein
VKFCMEIDHKFINKHNMKHFLCVNNYSCGNSVGLSCYVGQI